MERPPGIIIGGALIMTLGSFGILGGILMASSTTTPGYANGLPKLGKDCAPKLTCDISGGGVGDKFINCYYVSIMLLLITG